MVDDVLILLGTKGGPAVRNVYHLPTSSYLSLGSNSIVVDCGIGVTLSLVKAGIDIKILDAIFITHLHSDHLLELGPLIHTAWTGGRSKRLSVFGPEGIDEYWHHFLRSMAFDNRIRVEDEGRTPLEAMVDIHVFGEGHVGSVGDVRVESLQVKHPPVDDCYGLKFSHAEKVVCFSADTAYFEPLTSFAQGADLLVHEAMLGEGVDAIVAATPNAQRLREHLMASHTLAEDVGRIAAKANVKHLALHHLVPADHPDFSAEDFKRQVRISFDGRITVGRDGLIIAL